MHEIDTQFRKKKADSAARRRKLRLRRWLISGTTLFMVLIIGVVGYFWGDRITFSSVDDEEPVIAITNEVEPAYVPAIVELAGDPLIIQIGQDSDGLPKLRSIKRPPELAADVSEPKIEILKDSMISASKRFMTTLPSSQQDFAFFRAQSGTAIQSQPEDAAGTDTDEEPDEEYPADGENQTGESDDTGGWGKDIEAGTNTEVKFKKTRVEDTTSITTLSREVDRFKNEEDFFVRVLSTRTIDSILTDNKISPEGAKAAGEALKELFAIDELEAGYVVAIRGHKKERMSTRLQLVQLSVYGIDEFIGTLALSGEGTLVAGADPWVRDDLFNYSEDKVDEGPARQYRILDAIYSTAARNNVPSGIIGEIILYLSRTQDLNVFASPGDELTLIFSRKARDKKKNAGRVLYVGLNISGKEQECFVYRRGGKGPFSCLSDKDQSYSLKVSNGMVTPVNGVFTSGFGPRKHPVLKKIRLHKGADWAAPTGTPVYAAFDGKIIFAGDGKGYGNLIKIKHKGKRETRYAHMNRFATGAKRGVKVKAGDIIGYVGTTGLSTGPHLHFELYIAGKPTDPLYVGGGTSGSKSADVLVNKIIRVESAGNARAKNPLSTASGLGQFISSTWMRMIRRYRPDLAKSLSREKILELRFEPTIAREMLYKFTRENESYLRARGHSITPGRLYLAHFLGADGADTILKSKQDASVAAIMGPAVISANKFLTGMNAADIIAWAERKMRGRGKRGKRYAATSTRKKVVRASPEFKRFRAAMKKIVANSNATL